MPTPPCRSLLQSSGSFPWCRCDDYNAKHSPYRATMASAPDAAGCVTFRIQDNLAVDKTAFCYKALKDDIEKITFDTSECMGLAGWCELPSAFGLGHSCKAGSADWAGWVCTCLPSPARIPSPNPPAASC